MHNDRAHQAIGTASMSRRLDAQSRRMGLIGSTVTAQQRSQQIAGAIKELFPRIPDEDCSSIVERAFQTGANTVGNAVELPLARRVQLAVVAHIRHVHTDYDVLLKLFKWGRARQIVEEPCLQVITKWRGERDEHDDDLAELEQVFREVIVIDDSDNEDDFEAPSLGHRRRRSLSLEIVSQRTVPEPSSGYVSAPRKKKRRLSPPKYHSPPPLQHVNPHAPDIVHVRPQRGPLPRQILQLDEMTRRAEDLSPQILPQYQGNQLGRLPTTSSYSYPAAHRHTPAHAQDHRRQDLPGDQPMMPQIPEYAPPAGYNVAMAPPRNERVYQSIEGKASGYRYDGQHHERGY
ncbi:hypothetical protein FH972_026878 [Carpinus fangiana]|uniref:DUF2293 domain-containing protein n=1 Tax=Carpinus fangiana TaxID=176857 RepID=A0A5N6L5B7_9ROSI|nr:hypothetical protein FH972_026878 [Carpinus fangiana]KAB8976000.1 hypothetical protein FH972_026878 [Carpinus fangiana]